MEDDLGGGQPYKTEKQQNPLNIMPRYAPVESKILLVNRRRHKFY